MSILGFGTSFSGSLNYDSGDSIFGNGRDGYCFVSASTTTTLTSDMFYDILIVSGNLKPNGYRIRCKTALRVATNAVIENTGSNGIDAAVNGIGQGGVGTNSGTLGNGGNGGAGSNAELGGNGEDGVLATGRAGGGSGNGGSAVSASGGFGFSALSINDIYGSSKNSPNAYLGQIRGNQTNINVFGGGSGGGGGAGSGSLDFGGGGGGGGGPIDIVAKLLELNGTITSVGGNGGDGFSGTTAAGGGGGGGGGFVNLIYKTRIGNGTINVSGGLEGLGAGTGSNGIAGTSANLNEINMGPKILWEAKFDRITSGSYSNLTNDTGLILSRSSVATVQTNSNTFLTGVAINVARIGQKTSTTGSRGLVIEETRTNLLSFARQTTGTGWSAGIGSATQNYADGPDGQPLADRNNNIIGDYGNYAVDAAWTGWQAASCWLRATSEGGVYCASFGRDATANLDAIASSGTGSLVWQKIELAVSSSIQKTFVPVDSRGTSATSGGAVARAQDNITDGHQVENGKFSTELIYTTGSTQTRSADRLFHPSSSVFINDGRMAMEFRFIPKGAPTDYLSDAYLLSIDNGNYIKILSSSQAIVVSVNAVTHSFSPVVSWSRGDTIDLFIEAAGGRFPTKGKYRVNNGSTIIFNSSSAPQTALVATSSIDLFCSGTSGQLSSWIQWIRGYATYDRGPNW